MNETNKKIIRYIMLPQVLPRLRDFMSSGFGYIAFYMAMVYRAARLLPAGHPYLNPANMNRFGIRHVIAEAGSQIKWRRENVDQIAIFGLILMGLVLLCLQFVLLLVSAVSQTAQAAMPANYAEFFVTAAPVHDIAFVLLDRVFGVPDLFNSCVMQGVPCYNNELADAPYPFHAALHSILQFYSIGLMVIAVLIFVYFIMAILAETAQTGTPFGKRFNHVWAPIRMVVALGLLIPLGPGLNAAQYITLYAAKWGSGFATNGWILFVNTAVTGDQTLLGNRERLVATPNPPAVNELVVFFSTVATCVRGQEALYGRDTIEAYLMNPHSTGAPPQLSGSDYAFARDDYYGQSTSGSGGGARYESTKILIYFGEMGTSAASAGATGGGQLHPSRIQNTEPTCGAISLEITDVDDVGSEGSQYMNEQYYILLQDLWAAASGGGGGGAGGTMGDVINRIGEAAWLRNTPHPDINDPDAPFPTMAERTQTISDYTTHIRDAVTQAVTLQQASDRWVQDLQALGWAGAAIWYNQVATLNGSMIGATYNMPVIVHYPKVMEDVLNLRSQNSQSLQGHDRFRPYQPGGQEVVELARAGEEELAQAAYQAYAQWDEVGGQSTGNALIDMIRSIFGLDGLYTMVANTDVHPLAQLVAIGKSLVNRSIMSLIDATAGFAIANVANAFDQQMFGTIASSLGSFQGSLAIMGLGIGFTLFYVVPFLPFIYFFFAVGGWIKTIFEAMVGVPLWALAHIRIDGNGLPGDAAMGGYFLILEIFLRPILIIFGLLGSITIFAAQVRVLHEIWELVVSNVAGFDREAAAAVATGVTGAIEFLRSPIDEFFYTIIYAVIVYMLALSSFKLIDILPTNILRWMGASAQAFTDSSGEEAGGMMRSSMMGSNIIAGQLKGAAGGLNQAAGSGAEAFRTNIMGGAPRGG
jgi:conjugal transfer/type IV secretion protein DotA/TraY